MDKVKQFYIWGLGTVGRRVLKYLVPLCNVMGIIDNDPNKQAQDYCGLKVFPYNTELISGCGVILTMFNNTEECECKLSEDGIPFWHITEFLSTYYAGQGKLAIPFLDFPITGRCTLNCKYCMQFMPYRKDKQDVEADILKNSLETSLEQVDFIGEVSIIGGEPFLHNNLADIIKFVSNPKIGSIVITTNGMVLPSGAVLEACRENAVFVSISDYSRTLPRIKDAVNRFQEIVQAYGIECERKVQTWTDQGVFNSKAEVKRKCSRSHMQLIDNKLWYCSLQAGGNISGICNGVEYQDFIDLSKLNSVAQMLNVIQCKETSVCDRCLSRQGNVIPVAEQM